MIKAFIHRYISNTERKEVLYDDRNAPGGMFFVDNYTTTDGKRFTAKVKWFYAQSE
jgi:hypothetical protein